MTSFDVNNKWVCTFHTGIFRQKVKFNAVLIEYHGDSGIPRTKMYRPKYLKCDIIGCFWMFRTGRVSNTMAFYTVLM